MGSTKIGEHKLYWGDCLDIMRIFRDGSIDLIVTDPPYGTNYKSNRQGVDRKESIKGNEVIVRDQYFDEIEGDNKFPVDWIKLSNGVLKNNSAIYVFCHWKSSSVAREELEKYFKLKNLIILNKSNHGMGDLKGSYAPKHELMWFATKGRHLLNFPDGRGKDVWDVSIKFTGSRRLHPNEKPISWMEPAIYNSSSENDIVLDPFMGSGSTGEAAIKLGRRFIGIEKDEKYFEIAYNKLKEIYGRDVWSK